MLEKPYTRRSLRWHKLTSNLYSAMEEYLPTFRLEFPGTYNEYRVIYGHVQFRPEQGDWRTLDAEDVRMHFMLKTPVARWVQSTADQVQRGALA